GAEDDPVGFADDAGGGRVRVDRVGGGGPGPDVGARASHADVRIVRREALAHPSGLAAVRGGQPVRPRRAVRRRVGATGRLDLRRVEIGARAVLAERRVARGRAAANVHRSGRDLYPFPVGARSGGRWGGGRRGGGRGT